MDIIQRAGFMAWPVLAFSLLAMLAGGAGIVAALMASTRAGALVLPGVTMVLCVFVGAAGVFGYVYGLSQVEAAISGADPGSRAMLLAVGRDEAMQNLVLAAMGGALPALLAVAGLAIGATRKLDRA